jgi:hypothetical protein
LNGEWAIARAIVRIEPGAETQPGEVGKGLPSQIELAHRVANPVRDVAIEVAERSIVIEVGR